MSPSCSALVLPLTCTTTAYLPPEIKCQIAAGLGLSSLGTIRFVNKEWRDIVAWETQHRMKVFIGHFLTTEEFQALHSLMVEQSIYLCGLAALYPALPDHPRFDISPSLDFVVPASKKSTIQPFLLSFGYRLFFTYKGRKGHQSLETRDLYRHHSTGRIITVWERLRNRSLTDFLLDEPASALSNCIGPNQLIFFFPQLLDNQISFRHSTHVSSTDQTLRNLGFDVVTPDYRWKKPGEICRIQRALSCAQDTGYSHMLLGSPRQVILSQAIGFQWDFATMFHFPKSKSESVRYLESQPDPGTDS